MVLNNTRPMQESYGLYNISMVRIKKLEGAEGSQYTQTITIHNVSPEQDYSKKFKEN